MGKYIPLTFFILLVALLGYKTINTKPDNIQLVQNLYFDASKLKSAINNQPIIHPNNKYILHVCSSWCTTCKQNHYELIRLSNEKAIKIIGIIWQDKRENIDKMLQKEGNPYYDLINADEETIINLGISAIPETFIVSKSNRVLLKFSGEIKEEELRHAFYTSNN
ncbi:redoxin family protein [Candidatus Jidaibacter acanthamoebae]|nr:redoxin family protein [Candidatus Jidaibacter acanthamoeba]